MKAAKLWIWLSALASLAGWSLSVIGQLNRPGYDVFFGLVAMVLFFYRGKFQLYFPPPKKLLRRFRRPLPAAFAGLALLVFVGGVIYPPSNYTGLNYHLARVLQWLAHGQWCWIHTPIVRMNYSGLAFEWLTTPVVLFTQSDRALFLVNFIPFLLLPGLVFSVFTRLGVSGRVAWWWMWLLPTGYNFLLQAGSIGNDAFGAVFALAAVAFACRAQSTRRIGDVWTSVFAIALLAGTKPTGLPLALPWLMVAWPVLPLLRRYWRRTLPVAALALASSFLPIAMTNCWHSGDWLGRSVESTSKESRHPVVGVLGNALQLGIGNLTPPVFPLAGWWNHHAAQVLPQAFVRAAGSNFENGIYTAGELPTEDWTGLGFGVSLLLAAALLGAICVRGKPAGQTPAAIPRLQYMIFCATVWLALLVFGMKSGMNTAARLVTPYYPLLLPMLLVGGEQAQMVRRRWWRGLAGATLVVAFVVLVLSPDRPLWPAKTILSKLAAHHPEQAAIARALQVYTVYSLRNDALAGVRQWLPPDLKTVGFIGDADDCDISLWRPFGSRRVEHFLLTDSPAYIRQRAQIVVVGGFNLKSHGQTIDGWLAANRAELIGTTSVVLKISEGVQPWYVARLKPQ